jgi:hypothetical protein
MVVLTMLGELAGIAQRGENPATSILVSTLYYVVLVPIMPPSLHLILQRKIQAVIDALEDRAQSPSFLDLPLVYRPDVLRVLREWQHEVGELYPPAKLRPQIVTARSLADSRDPHQIQKYVDTDKSAPRAPPGCEKQEAFYRNTAILTLTGNGRSHGPELQKAFDEYDPAKEKLVSREFLSYIETTWKTNPTMIDLDYEKSREHHFDNQDLCHDPFRFGKALVAGGFALESRSGLFSYLHLYLTGAADSINRLGDRLKIEACVGDVTSILEQIR